MREGDVVWLASGGKLTPAYPWSSHEPVRKRGARTRASSLGERFFRSVSRFKVCPIIPLCVRGRPAVFPMPKRKTKPTKTTCGELTTLQPNAAGADIGAREIYVAVPPDRDDSPVRCFGTFTDQLHSLVDWLRGCRIDTLAMEATGVYWIPLAEMLEAAGIAVCLVNPRHVKNVPGRKTDVQDCQWLQYLHSVGLLRAAFRTDAEVRPLRVLWRHRDALVRQSAWHVQHMHKALDQMNVQIHHVIADITGVTGTAIVEAILAGKRDPAYLASLRDKRIKADAATLARALTGDYREEHLFCLRQAHAGLEFIPNALSFWTIQVEVFLLNLRVWHANWMSWGRSWWRKSSGRGRARIWRIGSASGCWWCV
jgi:transposase